MNIYIMEEYVWYQYFILVFFLDIYIYIYYRKKITKKELKWITLYIEKAKSYLDGQLIA